MTEESLRSRISTLEEELRILKSYCRKKTAKRTRKSGFSKLRGLLKGKLDLSFEEIQSAEFRERAGLP